MSIITSKRLIVHYFLCLLESFISSAMKRAMPWSDEEEDSSEESSSHSGSESDGVDGKTKGKDSLKPEKSSKTKSSKGKFFMFYQLVVF